MSATARPGTPAASGLVRVTVTSGTRRVDLVLPGAVPVAELLPELARSVGLLDPATVHGGYRVGTADGRRLGPEAGLTLQGVEDGGLLTVTAGVDEPAPRVYDDVVEAMADVVEHELEPWRPAAARRTALAAAAVLLLLCALALGSQRSSVLAVVAAGAVAVALTGAGIVLSRVRREAEAAVGAVGVAAVHAAVAGHLLAPRVADGGADSLALAGAGAALVGAVGLVGLGPGRILVLPPLLLGVLAGAVGALLRVTDADPARVGAVLLAAVVLVGSVLPWIALGATSTRADRSSAPGEAAHEHAPVDVARVAADARAAHEILLAISGTVGLLLVLVTPLAVGLGLAGTLLAIDACAIVMLRTRQYRTGSEVLVGLCSGILGLVAVAVTVLLVHDDWRPALAGVLAGAGAVVLAATLTPAVPSVRRGRLGDLLESIALLALLPLVVLAIGLFSSVRGAVG